MPVANEALYVQLIAYFATIFMIPAIVGAVPFKVLTIVADYFERYIYAVPFWTFQYLVAVCLNWTNFVGVYLISLIA